MKHHVYLNGSKIRHSECHVSSNTQKLSRGSLGVHPRLVVAIPYKCWFLSYPYEASAKEFFEATTRHVLKCSTHGY